MREEERRGEKMPGCPVRVLYAVLYVVVCAVLYAVLCAAWCVVHRVHGVMCGVCWHTLTPSFLSFFLSLFLSFLLSLFFLSFVTRVELERQQVVRRGLLRAVTSISTAMRLTRLILDVVNGAPRMGRWAVPR